MTLFNTLTSRFLRRALQALMLACGLVALSSSAALAETLTVTRTDDPSPSQCDPGNCSLREAINAANNDGGATIELQAGQTYTLTQRYGAGSPNPNGGALLVLHNTEIVSDGSGNAAVRGDGIERVFDVFGGSLTLRNIAVENGGGYGSVKYNGFNGSGGGGVLVNGGNLYAFGGAFDDNSTGGWDNGGAIANFEGHVLLQQVVLSGNSATAGFGGAIFTGYHGLTDVYDSTFSANTALSGGALASVGDIGASANVNVIRSTLQSNRAVHTSEVDKPQLGGAVYIAGTQGQSSANYNFANVTIDGNSAFDGGAIEVSDAAVTLSDATITRNSAQNSGGGIEARAGATSVMMSNTILAQDHALASYPDCHDTGAGTIHSHGYNIIGEVDGCTYLQRQTGDQIGTSVAPIDPKLGPLQNQGGYVPTDALLTGSPAIDAGDPSGSCQPTDARGFLRSTGGRCDIGAYEIVPAFKVKPLTHSAITVQATPTRVRAGRRVRIQVRLSSSDSSCVSGATVRVAGHRVSSDAHGRASLALRFHRAGVRTLVASKPGCAAGKTSLTIAASAHSS